MGYNTNVRHKGKLYHIQTEDAGVKRPHVITQLFADGGRILASEKPSYEEHLDADTSSSDAVIVADADGRIHAYAIELEESSDGAGGMR